MFTFFYFFVVIVSLEFALCIYLLCLTLWIASSPFVFFFLMIRRPPRSTLDRSSAASDVYKRQDFTFVDDVVEANLLAATRDVPLGTVLNVAGGSHTVSYTHLRAHETVLDLVCRLLLENTKTNITPTQVIMLNT